MVRTAVQLEQRVRQVSDLYRGLSYALLGYLDSVLGEPTPTFPATHARLQHGLLTLRRSMESSLVSLLREGMLEAAMAAMEDAEASTGVRLTRNARDQIRGLADGLFAATVADIGAQSQRDMTLLSAYHREFSMRVAALMNAGRHSYSSAVTSVRASFPTPGSQYVDAAGRRWGGERYISTLVHARLFETYNSAVVYAGLALGEVFGFLEAPDEGHPRHEMRFALAVPEDGLNSYDELRVSVLHPNSSLLVRLGEAI